MTTTSRSQFTLLVGVVVCVLGACSLKNAPETLPDGRLSVDEPPTKCSDDDPDAECLELADNAIRLDDETALGILRLEPLDDGSVEMEITDDSPLGTRIAPGLTIVRGKARRKPVLRTVDVVERQGNVFRIKTHRAGLREGYKRGRIKRRARFDDAAMLSAKAVKPNLSTLDNKDGIEFGLKNCATTLWNQGGLTVSLPECRFVIGLDIDMDWTWGSVIPDSWELTATGSIDANVLGRVEVDHALYVGAQTVLLNFPDVPIPGLPLTIGGELVAGYSVTSTGSVTVESGFTYEASRTVGFGWKAPLNIFDISYGSKEFTPRGPTVTGHASMIGEIYVKPVIEVKALGIVGGFAAIKAFAALSLGGDADTKDNGKYCYDLSVGFTPSFGISAGLIGFEIIKTEWETATVKTSLANACTGYNTPITTTCKATDNCRVDSDCPKKNVCSLPGCTADCLCADTSIDGCCLNDGDCATDSDGPSGSLPRTCVDNKCKITLNAPPGAKGGASNGGGKSFGVVERAGKSEAAKFAFGACIADFECNDLDPETVDTCLNDGTCLSFPTNPGQNASDYPQSGLRGRRFETGRVCQSVTDCDVDGDASTVEACREGECRRIPLRQADGKRCLVDAQCDDGNPETRDICIRRGCKNVERPSDPCAWRSCDDLDPRTEDTCVAGECKHRLLGKP